ncbi:MAG TPA: TolC family protein [Cytophagaceae bacterium]
MRGCKKRVSIGILLTIKLTLLYSQDSLTNQNYLPLSLSEVWLKATDYSKKIQLMQFETELKREEIREVQYERLPEIEMKGHIEYATNFPQYTEGLFRKPEQHEVIHILYRIGTDSYLNLYNGNKLNLTIDKKKLLYEIAEIQKKYTISEIKLQATTFYLHLLRSMLFKDLMLQDIAYQEKQLKEIRGLLKNGVALKNDELRVELKLSQQKLTLIQIENDIAIANQKLNILIGLPDEQLVEPVESVQPHLLPIKSYEDYLHEAEAHSYDYHISEKQVEYSKVHLQYIKANIRPKIGLYGDMWTANPQIFLYPYSPSTYTLGLFGIRASIPLSELYTNIPKTKLAMLEHKKEELAHHDIEDKIRQDVYEAFLRFKEALMRVDVEKVNIGHATENARIIKNNYINKTALITELLDADLQVLQTKFQYVNAQIEAQLKYYQLQHILGNL